MCEVPELEKKLGKCKELGESPVWLIQSTRGRAGKAGSGNSGPWVSDRSFACSSHYNKKPLKYLRREVLFLRGKIPV